MTSNYLEIYSLYITIILSYINFIFRKTINLECSGILVFKYCIYFIKVLNFIDYENESNSLSRSWQATV